MRIAFTMQLHPGKAAEYKRRHDELWPELAKLLSTSGISDYSIFLDEETFTLFAVMKVEDTAILDRLPEQPVMQKWWAFMGDIMETNDDLSPKTWPLKEVFHLN